MFKIKISLIIMYIINKIIDRFNTIKDQISMTSMKIQSITNWFDLVFENYLEELQMLVQCIMDSF